MIRSLLPGPSGALDAAGLDAAYACPPGRWVRANFATTVDGAIEVDGRSGGIGGPADRALFAHLRSQADVVLVASGTAVAERYGAVHLDGDALARRAGRGQAAGVPVAVVTGTGTIDPGSKLFTDAVGGTRPIVLTTSAAPASALEVLGRVAEVVVCGQTSVDPAAALDALAGRGLTQVLCEGGPTLLRGLVAAGVLDELCLTTAATLAGAGHGALLPGPPLAAAVPATLDLLCTDDDGTLFARYRIDRGP